MNHIYPKSPKFSGKKQRIYPNFSYPKIYGVLLLSVIILFSSWVYSYDVKPPVHQYIIQQSKDLWPEIPSEIKLHLFTDISIQLDEEGYNNGEDIIVGSGEEDKERDFSCDWGVARSIAKNIFQNDIETPFYYHFWNPDIPQGGLYGFGWSAENYNGIITDFGAWPDLKSLVASHCGTYYFESNYLRANKLWILATHLYLRGRIDEAFYWFGRIAHLLEDLTVPAHVHNDTHVPTDNDLYDKFTASSCDAYQQGNSFNAQHPY